MGQQRSVCLVPVIGTVSHHQAAAALSLVPLSGTASHHQAAALSLVSVSGTASYHQAAAAMSRARQWYGVSPPGGCSVVVPDSSTVFSHQAAAALRLSQAWQQQVEADFSDLRCRLTRWKARNREALHRATKFQVRTREDNHEK